MAGLKTSPKKKNRDSSKPNTILVIFLVFFILLSIGLGIWGYYGYAGQEKLETAAKTERNAAKAAKDFAEYAMYMANEARLAIGSPGNPKDPILDPDAIPFFEKVRGEVVKDNGIYIKEKTLEPFKKLQEALKADLGSFDEAAKKFPITYREKITKLNDDLKKNEALLATTETELRTANDKFQGLQTKQENYWKNALAEIKKGNSSALTASTQRTKEMEEQFALNLKLNQDNEEFKKQAAETEEGLKRKIKKLTDDVARLSTDKTEGLLTSANGKGGGDNLHALILDISKGKPLWDNPLGKITRVDLQNRQVYINLGSANGMKPEVTFNIFGAGSNGRAEKELKGTIEVIRVLDAHTSLARITSIYDAEGREIVLGDPRFGRPNREAENALKDGDLLYNTFWGSRVAIAGSIPFAGQASNNPAEQMRILDSFMHFLARQGIAVDSYLDLNDGQIKGAISNRTRYLIRGDDLVDPAAKPVQRKKVKDADGAEDKAEAPMADALPDRIKTVNDAAAKMRQEAADKGLLIISSDNFLNVIGYRQPRSAVYGEAGGFAPTLISAGQTQQNPNSPAPPPQKAEEK